MASYHQLTVKFPEILKLFSTFWLIYGKLLSMSMSSIHWSLMGFGLLYWYLLCVVSNGSGSILRAGADRASPDISIGQTAIVVVRTSYIWSYISVLPLPAKLWSQKSKQRDPPSLLVTTPRRWPFPFGPTDLSEFPTNGSHRKTLRKNPLAIGQESNPDLISPISSSTSYHMCHCAPLW